jgi:hypothetical protein
MGRRPGAGYSLDRINNNLGYTAENCKWATTAEQQRNTRTTKLTYASVNAMKLRREEGATYKQIAAEFGVSRMCATHAIIGKTWANHEKTE